jgi:hypothetical protein
VLDHICCFNYENNNFLWKVALKWKVAYTEDNDDSTSGKEMAEKGYTLPEYHFVAEYGDVKSEPGPVLEVRGWVKYIVKKEATGEIMANRKYTLFLPDQNTREGETDGEGVIYERDLPAGNK